MLRQVVDQVGGPEKAKRMLYRHSIQSKLAGITEEVEIGIKLLRRLEILYP
jgi:hypothetical protein